MASMEANSAPFLDGWTEAAAGGFSGNLISCSWVHYNVEAVCDGYVTCYVAPELRAPGPGGPEAAVVLGCNNGCAIDPALGFLCIDGEGGTTSGGVGPITDPPSGSSGGGATGAPNTLGDEGDVVSDTLLVPHLQTPPDSLRDQMLAWINKLPEWARAELAAIVNDVLSIPRRFKVYYIKVDHPAGDGWVPMAVRHPSPTNVHSFFWAYMGPGWVNEYLLRSLCEEAAHLHYNLRDGDPQLEVRINQCLSEIPQ